MFLQIRPLPDVDNLRNYPAEIIKELRDLLQAGGEALPDPKRSGFYDIEKHDRTFFIYISPITDRVWLLATWQSTILRQWDIELDELGGGIRARAYELYEKRGKGDDHAFDDWLEAEMELMERKIPRIAA